MTSSYGRAAPKAAATEEVASPCENICQLDPRSGYCIGCLRTIDEIGDWLEMTNEEKRNVLKQIDARKRALS